MTRRGGREVSVGRRGIGENERQPEMARLAAWWRCSNLVILVRLRERNYPSKAYVRRGRKKSYTEERGTP